MPGCVNERPVTPVNLGLVFEYVKIPVVEMLFATVTLVGIFTETVGDSTDLVFEYVKIPVVETLFAIVTVATGLTLTTLVNIKFPVLADGGCVPASSIGMII